MDRRSEPNRSAIYATTLVAFLAIAGIAVVDPILPAIGEAIGVTAWQVELLFTAYIAVMALGMIPATLASGASGSSRCSSPASPWSACRDPRLVQRQHRGASVLRASGALATRCSSPPPWWCWSTWPSTGNGWSASSRPPSGLGFAVGPLIGGLLGEIAWRLPFFVCGCSWSSPSGSPPAGCASPPTGRPPVRRRPDLATYRRPAFIALCVGDRARTTSCSSSCSATRRCSSASSHPAGARVHRLGARPGRRHPGGRPPTGPPDRRGADRRRGDRGPARLHGAVRHLRQHRRTLVVLVSPGSAWAWPTPTSPTWRSASAPATGGIATGAFNLVRWGAAAPAPIIAGKLAETRWRCRSGSASGCSPSASSTWLRARDGRRLRRAGAVVPLEPSRAAGERAATTRSARSSRPGQGRETAGRGRSSYRTPRSAS